MARLGGDIYVAWGKFALQISTLPSSSSASSLGAVRADPRVPRDSEGGETWEIPWTSDLLEVLSHARTPPVSPALSRGLGGRSGISDKNLFFLGTTDLGPGSFFQQGLFAVPHLSVFQGQELQTAWQEGTLQRVGALAQPNTFHLPSGRDSERH